MVEKVGMIAVFLMILATGYFIGVNMDDIKSSVDSVQVVVEETE